jgi:serine protease AprX
MYLRTSWLNLIAILCLLGSITIINPAAPALAWESKIDPWVLNKVTNSPEAQTEFLLFLNEQADLSGAAGLKTKLEKGTYVFQHLTALANRTQKPVIAALDAQGAAYESYWIANMIWVRGNARLLQSMAQRPDIAHIYANPYVRLQEPAAGSPIQSPQLANTIEWNILKVNADKVWGAGYRGQGVVIGGQDTGYQWDHPALINQYRGSGTVVDHNYNWHDAIHSGGGVCGPDSPVPCDDYGHGTHTMGIMVGDDGAGDQIGMAPEAKWIGCRNMNVGVGSPATYSECYEWFIAPYPIGADKTQGDPSKAPDVIDNSWSCPPSEGCTDPNVLLTVVNNVRAAGIVTVQSAGNSGSSCSTISDPAAIYDSSFTVGNTTSSDTIASSSSRGPVISDGSGRLKPDISAPGTNIRSSYPVSTYANLSGTSMAAPHVVGLVALLISAQPNLAGQVGPIESLIEHSAVHLTSPQTCGNVSGDSIPNNTYGWGRIDAQVAVGSVAPHRLTINKSVSSTSIRPGGILTYTLDITHLHPISVTTNVILTDTIPVNTTFITATLPHTFDGSTVQWDFASLNANERRSVELVVRAPLTPTLVIENAHYGASSVDVSAPVSGNPVTTTVISEPGIMLAPEHSALAWPGELITYTHTLTNTTGITDTYDLSYTSSLGWKVNITTPVTLPAGKSIVIPVGITIPGSAARGSVDTTQLTATARSDIKIAATVVDTTVVGYYYFFPAMRK